jgi:hypothetical protein
MSKKKLTSKERKLLRALPTCKTQGEAAILAGYSPKNPSQSAHTAIQSLKLKVPELMDELGLTEKGLIENHLVPALSATRKEYFSNQGIILDERESTDWPARLRSLEMAFKLRDMLGDARAAVTVNVNSSMNIDFEKCTDEELRTILRVARGHRLGEPIDLSPLASVATIDSSST